MKGVFIMKLYFPDVQIEKFDFDEDWLIRSTNPSTYQVLYEGLGKNKDLEMVISYQDNTELFQSFGKGELVQLPKELFLQPEEAEPCLEYECF